jgi:hypothetical protein
MEIKGIEAVKETKGLDEVAGTDVNGRDGIDNSRPMITHKYCTCQDKLRLKVG